MKTTGKWLAIIAAGLFLTGCGTASLDSIQPVIQKASVGQDRKMVVLPFADYTPADSPAAYWRRNVLIMESLQDEMLRFGYTAAVNEDVVSYLSEKKIIQPQAGDPAMTSTANEILQAELAKDWSDTMKVEIARVMVKNLANKRASDSGDFSKTYRSTALDHRAIRDIGAAFNADYVVRGRIVVFQNGREDSFNPLQTGVLPFFFNVGSRALFGIAESDHYEMIDKMAIGGLLGAVAADDTWPFDGTSTTVEGGHPRFGGALITEATQTELNAAVWGAAGAGLGYLAHKGGRVDNAVVQLRMIVQATGTGEIIWTNRAEVKTMPRSAFNKIDGETLTAQAIQQVCSRLFDSFVATETNHKVVRINNDGTLYVTPVGGKIVPSGPSTRTIQIDSPVADAEKRKQLQ
jgi:hypothetical protein